MASPYMFLCVLLLGRASIISAWIFGSFSELDSRASPLSPTEPVSRLTDTADDSKHVERELYIPDVKAVVGRLFQLKLPWSVATGTVEEYELHAADRYQLPRWLYFNRTSYTLLGVPSSLDQGVTLVDVIAHLVISKTTTVVATNFLISILPAARVSPVRSDGTLDNGIVFGPQSHVVSSLQQGEHTCGLHANIVRMTLVLDANVRTMPAPDRVTSLCRMAVFLNKDVKLLTLQARGNGLAAKVMNVNTLAAGQGNASPNTENVGVELSWVVACGMFKQVHEMSLVMQHNVLGGRITEELGYNIIGWLLTETQPPGGSKTRHRRQANIIRTPIPTATAHVPFSLTSTAERTSQAPGDTAVNVMSSTGMVPIPSRSMVSTDQTMHQPNFGISPTPSSSAMLATVPALTPSASWTSSMPATILPSFESSASSHVLATSTPAIDFSRVPVASVERTISVHDLLTAASVQLTGMPSEMSTSSVQRMLLVTGEPGHERSTATPVSAHSNSVSVPTETSDMPADSFPLFSATESSIPLIGSVMVTSTLVHAASKGPVLPTSMPAQPDFLTSLIPGIITSSSVVKSQIPVTSPAFAAPTAVMVTKLPTEKISTENTAKFLSTGRTSSEFTAEGTVTETRTTGQPQTLTEASTVGLFQTFFTSETRHDLSMESTAAGNTTTDSVLKPYLIQSTSDSLMENLTNNKITSDVTGEQLSTGVTRGKLTADFTTEQITTDFTTEHATTDLSAKQITTDFTTKQVTTEITTKQITTDFTAKQITTDFTTKQITTDFTTEQITTDFTTEQITTDFTTEQITTDLTTEQTATEFTMDQVMSDFITEQMSTDFTTKHVTTEGKAAQRNMTEAMLGETREPEMEKSLLITTQEQATGEIVSTTVTRVTAAVTHSTVQPLRATTEIKQTTERSMSDGTIALHLSTQAFPDQPPALLHPINEIHAQLGTYFHFSVPTETFYDHQDGDTANLALSLYNFDMTELASDSWVQFMPDLQVIHGIPMEDGLASEPSQFILVAEDSNGAQVTDVFRVTVNSTVVQDVSHSFLLRIDVNFGDFKRKMETLVHLLRSLSGFFGDLLPEAVTVTELQEGSVILQWTNNTLSKTQCENDTVLELFSKMFTEGAVDFEFQQALLPEFPVNNVSLSFLGVCLRGTESEGTTAFNNSTLGITSSTEAGSSGESDLSIWLVAVILAVLIALILLGAATICCIMWCKKRRKHSGRYLPDHEKAVFRKNRKPIFLPNELPEKDVVNRPKRPAILESEREPNTFTNKAFQPPADGTRASPPPYVLPNDDAGYGQLPDQPDGLTPPPSYHSGDGPPYSKPPPAYKLPPPYAIFPGSSDNLI